MKYEYDIAISYKSEIEEKASKIADYLIADGWKVFFAPIEQQELLSEKIHQKLYDIYKNKSLLKVLLISEAYLDGEWTSIEKRVSLQSTKEERKRLLIVNYTNHITLPGELQSLQYVDGNKLHEDEIASLVTERLKKYLENSAYKKQNDAAKTEHMDKVMNITINHGIIAGDNASFGSIQL